MCEGSKARPGPAGDCMEWGEWRDMGVGRCGRAFCDVLKGTGYNQGTRGPTEEPEAAYSITYFIETLLIEL